VVASDWSGLYAGVDVGATWQSASNWTYFNPNNGARFSLTNRDNWGVLGGVQGGYNWQSGALIFGVEGDASRASLSETRTVPTIGAGSFAQMSAGSDWLGSARGRVGFAGWNNMLFYLTGGPASANIEAEILQMEASIRLRLARVMAFFKPKASPSATDPVRGISAPRREPVRGEFPVVKTHLSRGF
jgi:outer membrane immunogenic protein